MTIKSIGQKLIEKITGGYVVTEKDLKKLKLLNLQSFSGTTNSKDAVNKLLSYGEYSKGEQASGLQQVVLAQLQNLHFAKFDYLGEFDWETLEYYLFTWGMCGVYKRANGKIVFGKWEVVERDENNLPIKVNLRLKNDTLIKDLEVDKDIVLFYDDRNFVFVQNFLGGVFFVWELIDDLCEIYKMIKDNVKVNRAFIAAPVGTTSEGLAAIKNALYNTEPVIQFETIDRTDSSVRNNGLSLDMRDRTMELWENFYNTRNVIRERFGVPVNENTKKAEKQSINEITKGDLIANSILQTQLKFRKKTIEKMNRLFNMNVMISLNEKFIDDKINVGVKESNNE